MTSELDGVEVEEITHSLREGVELYKHGESVAITTPAVRNGEAEAIHLTYDELMNLLVDARPHFREDDDD